MSVLKLSATALLVTLLSLVSAPSANAQTPAPVLGFVP
jgi:hypothetical protein